MEEIERLLTTTKQAIMDENYDAAVHCLEEIAREAKEIAKGLRALNEN